MNGKFIGNDPEDSVRHRIVPAVTPQVPFATIVASAKQARAKGPNYDSIWTVLESLILEVDDLHNEINKLKESK